MSSTVRFDAATQSSWDTVRLRVWRGTVPIFFSCPGHKAQLKLDVPRLSYLPLAFAKLREVFNLRGDAKIWLTTARKDHPREVLLTHMPAGLLYDLHTTSIRDVAPLHLVVIDDEAVLPNSPTAPGEWPAPPRLSLQDEYAILPLLWQTFKQALHLRLGSLRWLQSLTPSQSAALQRALLMLDMTTTYDLGQRLLQSPLQSVPVRLCISSSVFLQMAVPLRTQGGVTTVKDCIAIRMPDMAILLVDPQNHEAQVPGVLVYLHGAAVPLDTPLSDLLEEAAYADAWLYFVLLPVG
ncbi:autophagy protein Apg5-domain-containing protein [Protomyces lactucae-debilis]|uniref:Autophagy protein 5 n=1 Tax=Protomyces lactucae-debilis TaxID=2754530 RepID=A0A1Y2FU44_PROLT|nr:autophagy protein Apg5-domain-containing protein [Protomyces lactucae-debilis]ORY87541.1 autophagy protein Apg5-domain-containing protein [Protomyces lactucae-debilis]